MKFPIIATIVVSTCAFASIAQAELKIASVNMQDLYKSYYKRFDVEKRLGEQKISIETDIRIRSEKIQVLAKELNTLRQKADPSLSAIARKKIQAEFTTKLNEAQAAEQEFKSFQSRRQLAFQEMQKTQIMILLREIQETIDTAASKGNYDLVVDREASSPPLGTRVFPHVKSSLDITPEMMEVLNKEAPASYNPQEELKKINGGV